MITFMDPKEKIRGEDNCLDSQFWHACAGGMIQMPLVNAYVYYFVQGHIEHSGGNVDFRNFPRIPPYVLCRVEAIKYLADQETDEVYAKLRLLPIGNEPYYGDDSADVVKLKDNKLASFAKTLTQSDANNGGGFSVPRYCAETIFPRLNYTADPPVQNIVAKDVHGESWKFRHIYRGTPRRHLLTTGWSGFVNAKKLIAGDSIVFLRAENGDLCVGIRRANRGLGVTYDSSSGWNPGSNFSQYGGSSAFLRDGENNQTIRNDRDHATLKPSSNMFGMANLKIEYVVEAANNVSKGQFFEVVYYPRSGSPEFVVKASLIKAALQIRWCSGMRFKMPFETEDSSRISWFMGTVSSVQVADPMHWPNSPWRLLQVTWDEPDLLQNVKRVSPWLVELVSNMSSIHSSPFFPPKKRFRLPHLSDVTMDGQLSVPPFPANKLGTSNPFGCLPENSPAGMQGARHVLSGLLLSDLHMSNLQSGIFPASISALDSANTPTSNENISFFLTMGNSNNTNKPDDPKAQHQLRLFGKQIVTEQQMSLSISGDSVSQVPTGNSLSEGSNASAKTGNVNQDNHQEIDSESETGHCKVFLESEDVGCTVDLSLLNSYEELWSKLAIMFGMERFDMLKRVVYRDRRGLRKQIGDEPFSEFTKIAKRLTIMPDSSNDNLGA